MKIAFVCSNSVAITPHTKKGTEIFDLTLLNHLKQLVDSDMQVTVFASGDSHVPYQLYSVNPVSPVVYDSIPVEKRIIFELALLSKAFERHNDFDLYHVNIGNGDIVVPFAPFIKKPILITIHFNIEDSYVPQYFDLFKSYKNLYFVATSKAQQRLLPNLRFAAVIPHGIDEHVFEFDPRGGEKMIWAGRGVVEKGLDIAMEVAIKVKKPMQCCIIRHSVHPEWLTQIIDKYRYNEDISIRFDVLHNEMVRYFQQAKLFLFSMRHEEIFGLVSVESMACGTPVAAFARGTLPEIIEDGKTGFLVNPSEDDIRGDFIVKKTGVEGLIEAVERIYAMDEDKYKKMRKACRELVEQKFTAHKMAERYKDVYKKLI